jgi:hypothetical protein
MLFVSTHRRSNGGDDNGDESASSRRRLLAAHGAAALAHRLALIDIEGRQRLGWYRSHFDPDQPRVSAGHPDGGQWTRVASSGAGVQLAANEKPPFGANIISSIMAEAARRAIERYRNTNNLWDLFKRKDGTVSLTTIDGKNIFGSNSNSPTYSSADRAAASRMRDLLMEKYPETFATDNSGQMPANAVFHAETTVLLRAAREHGGSLAGRILEVFVDSKLCNNCKEVLPKVGLELGNPTVILIDNTGAKFVIRDGIGAR